MEYKVCQWCGKRYELNKKYSKKQRNNSKYCSYKCIHGKITNAKKECIVCGGKFRVHGKKRKETAKWCSHKCQKKEEHFDINTGYIRSAKNGRGIHRNIAEEHLKRKLKIGEVVHHINGNKLDNNITNLLVMTNSDHMKLHKNVLKRWENKNNWINKMV